MEAALKKEERPAEQDIYTRLWDTEAYRRVSPGENCVHEFLMQARPVVGSTILDLGCGTGRAGLLLALPPPAGANMTVTFVDFTDNCLDPEIKQALSTQPHALKFVQADLTEKLPVVASYGFCADVLEHIPTEQVNNVLNNCLMACQHVFFQISTVQDVFGGVVGHPLHLTVKPYEWWLEQFKMRDCVIHWSRDNGSSCMFYVSAWVDGKAIEDSGQLNLPQEQVNSNLRHNIKQGWTQVEPHETTLQEVMILGGGPSLSQFEDEIRRRRAEGVKLITLNGAYNWALEHGLTPSATVVVDARAFNARFTKPVVDDCRYLICSQCDPSVLEGLPKDRTYLWHSNVAQNKEALDEQYEKRWWWVPGGTTVLLRALPLLRMLGYKRFHLYGCDSCVMDDAHHAYEQKENDGEILLPTTLQVDGQPCGRTFMTTTWQASQAHEFLQMIDFLGDEIELQIHGDGLLAYILRTGAEFSPEEKE